MFGLGGINSKLRGIAGKRYGADAIHDGLRGVARRGIKRSLDVRRQCGAISLVLPPSATPPPTAATAASPWSATRTKSRRRSCLRWTGRRRCRARSYDVIPETGVRVVSDAALDLFLAIFQPMLFVADRIADLPALWAFRANARANLAPAHLTVSVRRVSPCFPRHLIAPGCGPSVARGGVGSDRPGPDFPAVVPRPPGSVRVGRDRVVAVAAALGRAKFKVSGRESPGVVGGVVQGPESVGRGRVHRLTSLVRCVPQPDVGSIPSRPRWSTPYPRKIRPSALFAHCTPPAGGGKTAQNGTRGRRKSLRRNKTR